MPELALRAPEELVSTVQGAKAARQVSIAELDSEPDPERPAQRTRRLAECIPQADCDSEDYIDHLERKHSWRS